MGALLVVIASIIVTMIFVCLFIKFDQKKAITKKKVLHLFFMGLATFVLGSFTPLAVSPLLFFIIMVVGQAFWYFKIAKDITMWQSIKIFFASNLASMAIFGYFLYGRA